MSADLEDAQRQADRMLRQHAPDTALRTACETALDFRKGTRGRAFWAAVAEELQRRMRAGREAA